MEYKQQLEQYRQRCEQSLQQTVDTLLQSDSAISDAAKYSLLNGGKRVRGVLVLAVCDLLKGDCAAADSYAAAIEMVHAFSLIHDDLPCMDDDDLRRGKPATHIQYGEASALLAGDLLSIQAFEAIATAKASPESRLHAVQCLSAAAGARGMIFGQELDLKYESIPADTTQLYRIHRHKTGALITAAVQLGLCTGKASGSQQEALVEYAEKIGLVFQIVDDILDHTSSTDVLGKPVGSDYENGKTTFVSLLGIEMSRQKAEEDTMAAIQCLQSVFADNATFLVQFAKNMTKRLS